MPSGGPIMLKAMGSFHVGGKQVEISGRPVREVVFTPGGVPARVDPNGSYMVGQMYAQYYVPEPARGRFPLLMWHGGGLTGVSWETTPDGREGWMHYFLRRGWPVYVSDAVERGRASWAMYPDLLPGEPLFLTVANPWERFRIGAGAGSWNAEAAQRRQLPGNQFPADGYLNFVKQIVPRWTTTDALILDAYTALLDKVGPSVLVVHSQGGQFGYRATQARPDKVRALVLIEPAGLGDPSKMEVFRNIPQLLVYGDHIEQDSRWPTIRRNGIAFAERAKQYGGSVDVIDLPARGVRGNSHMLMMDRNSDAAAALVQEWLAAKGLWS
ncbi:MAG: esterase [Alphaproteobacteria bacterium]|nr:esterase [Alphaproteobacteria bacterium]